MSQFDDAGIAADYDDLKVDEFAAAMKAKMAKKRDQGRGGWDDPAQCTVEHLARLLLSHIEKGDPVDIASFCMMLYHRKGSKAIERAARDYYAPKLNEGEAVEAVAKAIHHTPYTVPWEYSNVQARENARDKAKAALRATCVRFKEEV